ncbi:MAG: DUF433 domain-containing protein [Nostoc sp.]|uniref:DUF433 domain-containing protein n=1 Tax=Nostoc sp. TaxID=1180 RepID=UPI002FFBA2A3
MWTLVAFRQQGADEEELLRNYSTLTHDDLKAAWTYYEQHQEQLDRAIIRLTEDDDG